MAATDSCKFTNPCRACSLIIICDIMCLILCFLSSVTQCIAKLSKLIGIKWKDLAHHLGLQKTEIDAIEYNNLLNLEEQIFQFFDKWRQQQGQDASVEKLVEGLRAARLQEQLDSLGRAGLLLKGQLGGVSKLFT